MTNLKPARKREWRLRNPEVQTPEAIRALADQLGLSEITLRVLFLRGFKDVEQIKTYLEPRLDQLPSPWTIKDMDKAVEVLVQTVQQDGELRVFGDYDVDGTTGAALLTWFFRDLGFKFSVRQPDRFKDGYGLNVQAVKDAFEQGVKLLITVDCGITSFAAIEEAHRLGLPVIILDHHQIDPEKGLPLAVATVNPQRKDCESGLRQLCGCGIAFYFALALRAKGRELGWFETTAEPNLKLLLDLVVIATAADQVPLTGVNRILVRHGLELLKNSDKPGVRALLEVAGVNPKNISPSHLGFTLGPRINASGRMQSASTALELLTTQDPARAMELAQEIEDMNRERAQVQNEIWDEMKVHIEAEIAKGRFQHGIVVASPAWHEGVVGIVASRVTETFHKPAVVISIREDFGKGSVRTFAGKDVLKALQNCSAYLRTFGGHRHAAGLSIEIPQIEAFADAFDREVGALPTDESDGALYVEGECELDELNYRALQELERLGPFGNGNPEPVFRVRGQVRNASLLKGRHLKFQLFPEVSPEISIGKGAPAASTAKSAGINAIWFHADERHTQLMEIRQAEMAVVPELNRFGGRVTPTLRVRDLKFNPELDPPASV